MRLLIGSLTLLFLVAFGFFAYWNFNPPTFLLFQKTSSTRGEVTQVEHTYGVKGYHYQKITYKYTVNDSTYTGCERIGKRRGRRKAGDLLKVKIL